MEAKSKLIQIPFMTNCKLSKDMGPQSDADLEVIWVIPFQNVIWSFMYAMVCKRLDIGHVKGLWINLWLISNNHIGLQWNKFLLFGKHNGFWLMFEKKHQGWYYGQGTFWQGC